jgi:hypothetical protein
MSEKHKNSKSDELDVTKKELDIQKTYKEIEKLEYEKEKLQLENIELQKKWYKNPNGGLFSLLLLFHLAH